METVKTTVDLEWKPFNVDVESINKSIQQSYSSEGYCGASANSKLQLHFTTVLDQKEIDAIHAVWESITDTSPEVLAYKSKQERKSNEEAELESLKISAQNKLKALGLTDAEIAALSK